MTEEIDYSLSLSDFEEKYAREQALRDKQESSKAVLMQEQEDVSNNEVGKIIESDIVSSEDDNPGVFDYMAGFGKHVGVGVAKGFEEAGQTLRMLDDDDIDYTYNNNNDCDCEIGNDYNNGYDYVDVVETLF